MLRFVRPVLKAKRARGFLPVGETDASMRYALRWLIRLSYLYLVGSFILFFLVPDFSHRLAIDSTSYLQLAANFLNHGSFDLPGVTSLHHSLGLGYPFFIAAIWHFHDLSVVILMQMACAFSMIPLAFRTALWFFDSRVSLFAAIFTTLNVGLWVYPQFVLTETIFAGLLLIAFERSCAYLVEGNPRWLAGTGFFYGLSVLINPTALYYGFFWVLLLAFFAFKSKNQLFKIPRISLRHVGIFLLAFLIPVGGYVLRNKNAYGYFYLKSVDRVNLYTHYLPQLVAQGHDIPLWQARRQVRSVIEVKEYASGKGWDRAYDMLRKEVKENPFIALKVICFNMLKTLGGLYTNHLRLLFSGEKNVKRFSFFDGQGSFLQRLARYLRMNNVSPILGIIALFELLWQIIRYAAVGIAIVILGREKRFLELLLFGSFIAYFLATTSMTGNTQLRFMFEVPLIILSAVGIDKIKALPLKRMEELL